jgi:hypothetical protein
LLELTLNNEKFRIELKPALELAYQQPLDLAIDNTISVVIHALARDGKLIASSPMSEKKIPKSAPIAPQNHSGYGPAV